MDLFQLQQAGAEKQKHPVVHSAYSRLHLSGCISDEKLEAARASPDVLVSQASNSHEDGKAVVANASLPPSMLGCALALAAGGFAVFPCRPKGKAPLTQHGFHDASTEPAKIREWWHKWPDANVGMYAGIVRDGKRLLIVDEDPRNGGDETLHRLQTVYGSLPDTVVVLTGGGGRHFIFWVPEKVHLKHTMGDGIDLISRNGYVIGVGSVHASGQQYTYEASSDPAEGQAIADAPDWIIANFSKEVTKEPATVIPMGNLSDAEILEYKADLRDIPASCSRKEWLETIMAMNSRSSCAVMRQIADEWSQTCPEKYSAADFDRTWNSLKRDGGITIATLKWRAQQERAKSIDLSAFDDPGFFSLATAETEPDNLPQAPADEPAAAGQSVVSGPPPELLTIPGVLGVFVKWINDTAVRPQPYFAVVAALAFASVVMGRMYRTTAGNWSSLFFLIIGKSASGKEHPKTAIEQALRAADLDRLVGPSEYTSDSAVDGALRAKATHIAIMDEMGLILEAANAKSNHIGGTAKRRMMEAYGRCDGTLRPKAYSTAGLTAQQRAGLDHRPIENPALTVLGMTTPETFYNAISSGSVKDGFLNRFTIVSTDIGRQPRQRRPRKPVPDSVIAWAKEVRGAGSGNVFGVACEPQHNEIPVPIEIAFDEAADRLFDDFELKCIARQDELDKFGVSEMFGRVHEIAMRLSMIVAVSDGRNFIGPEHAQWSINFALYWADKAVADLIAKVADSPFGALCNEVAELVMKEGRKGLTRAELSRRSARIKGSDMVTRNKVLEVLAADRNMKWVTFPPPSGRGKPREAFVYVPPEDGEE